LPGGFSALRRMYEDVQEPMMDALSSGGANAGGTSSSTSGSNTTQSQNVNSGAAGQAMPNPWARPSSTTSSTNANTNNNRSGNSLAGAANPWGNFGGNGDSNANNGGLPDLMNMGNMMGGNMNGVGQPNLEQTIQMLENPMIQQMMNQMMSNPAMMQTMMDSNPMLRQMREQNPQIAAMMSNPEMIRSMMNPDNLRAMAQMQSAFGSMGMPGMPAMNTNQQFNPWAGGGSNGPTDTGVGGSAGPGLDFSSLLSQMRAASVSPSSANRPSTTSTAVVPPEQRYRMQLQSLNDMGFDDNRVNIAALQQTHGNVNRAVDVLLTNPPPPAQIQDVGESTALASSIPATPNDTTNGDATGGDDNAEDVVDKNEDDKKND